MATRNGTVLIRSVACAIVFFTLCGHSRAAGTYDYALTSGAPITNTYVAGGAQSTSVVVDKTNGTNLWWMYPDPWGLSAGTGTITMAYTGAGSVTTTVNMASLNIAPVNAYPFFFLGCFETSCIAPPTQQPSFPLQLNTLSSMPVDFAYSLTGSDFHGDITFDEWISDTPYSTTPKEVMVMTDFNFGYGYYGTHIENVSVPATVNGTATMLPFTVYFGGNSVFFILDSTQHPYITSGEVQFDLLYFLKEGARIDGASSAYYVQGIEFGTEFGNSATQNYTFNLTKFNIDPAASPAPSPSPTPTPSPSVGHVFLLLEENTGYSSVVGNTSEMPYFNSLIRQGALATSYYANYHPSLPNYIELTSGSNNGVTTDECGTSPTFPSISADNLVRHLVNAGVTWHAYAEDIPATGYLGCSTGYYDSDHVPFRDYTDVQNSSSQQRNIVPFTQFATDLKNGTLAQINYIAPNMVNDGHSCPGFAGTCSPTQLQNADSWLNANIQPLLNSPMFQAGGDGLLIIVWDEGDFADSRFGGGQVAWLAIGPQVKGGYQQGSTTVYQHDSTLRLIMEKVGLTSFPGGAATAPEMTEFFNSASATPTPTPAPTPTPTPRPTLTPTPTSTPTPTPGATPPTPTPTPKHGKGNPTPTPPTPTPTPTVTPTPAPTATPTPSPTPAPAPAQAPAVNPQFVDFVQDSNRNNAPASSVTVSVPAAAVVGNMLFAQITATYGTPGTITAPAGWTLISNNSIANQTYQWIYWHAYTGSDPTSWTWTFSGTGTYYPGGAIIAVSGASSSPVDAVGGQTGSGGAMTAPSVTANYSNDLLLVWEFDQNGWDTLSNPSALTVLTNSNGTVDGDQKLSSSGATGTRTSNGATGNWAAAAIAVH